MSFLRIQRSGKIDLRTNSQTTDNMSIANQKTNVKQSGKDVFGIRLRSGKVLSLDDTQDDEAKFSRSLGKVYDFFVHSFDDNIINHEQCIRIINEFDERVSEVSWTFRDISQIFETRYHRRLADMVIWAFKTDVIKYDQYLGLLRRL